MIILIFDCLRSPYDFANILQAAIAADICEIHITGKSLRHNHPKVIGKVRSWLSKDKSADLSDLSITYHASLVECIEVMRRRGVKVVGTSPHVSKSFFDLNLVENLAIVFGTESSGLSDDKSSLVDDMVKIPMSANLAFMTLSVITPIVIYEALRQQKG